MIVFSRSVISNHLFTGKLFELTELNKVSDRMKRNAIVVCSTLHCPRDNGQFHVWEPITHFTDNILIIPKPCYKLSISPPIRVSESMFVRLTIFYSETLNCVRTFKFWEQQQRLPECKYAVDRPERTNTIISWNSEWNKSITVRSKRLWCGNRTRMWTWNLYCMLSEKDKLFM